MVVVLAAGARPALADSGEPMVLVDLRPTPATERRADRRALREGLAGIHGLSPRAAPELAAAFGADPLAPLAERARRTLEQAADAYGALDCETTDERTADALTALAALRAAGEDRAADLRQALVYRLLCAHNGDDTAGALRAAALLRRLGGDAPPEGVPDAVWEAYPAIDATTDRQIVALTVETRPAGATVQVDLEPAGTAPADRPVAEGEHLVAAASTDGATARWLRVDSEGPSQSVTLALPEPEHRDVLVAVRSWRAAGGPPDPARLGALLGEVGVRFAAVIRADGTVQVWGLGPGDTSARMMGEPVDSALEIGHVVQTRVQAWEQRAPDPDLPLLREAPARRGVDGDENEHHDWWVYGSIIGAVAVGAAVILANDLADDRQRIELSWP